jgi:hypothetical protein
MTVETILHLKPALLTCYDDAVAILQQAWEERNRTTESIALVTVLSAAMDRCNRQGVTYPRVFLLRKGQLQRGEFQPRREIRTLPDPGKVTFTAPSHPKIPDEWIERAVKESVESWRARFGPRS